MGALLDQTTVSILRRPGAWSVTTGAWVPVEIPQSINFEIVGDPLTGEPFQIVIEGVHGYTLAPADPSRENTGELLRAAMVIALAALPVTVSGIGANVIITADEPGYLFDYYAEWESVAASITESVITESVPGAPFEIVASAPQPVGPETIEMIPEGARASARYLIYVPDGQADLILIDATGANAADHAQYDGREFLIASINNWESRPLGYKGYALLEVSADEQ